MKIEPLDVPDSWLCAPPSHADQRGSFTEWFRADLLASATGRGFTVVQANHAVSRRGTLRGLHFCAVPPGQAKFVYCSRGAVLDVIVDVRVGSPSYGAHVAVRLDDGENRRGVFVSEGLGHAYCALSDDAEVVYLVNTTYDPAAERGIDPLDPDLALPWPDGDGAVVLSDKDAAAPGLAQANGNGLLPSHAECLARYAAQ